MVPRAWAEWGKLRGGMTLDEAMDRLRRLGDEKVRERNARQGAGDGGFGVKTGDLRALAKEIKADPELATALWETGHPDARMLAVLLMKPKAVPAERLDAMVREATFGWLADWVNAYLVKLHPKKEALRTRWMASDHPWAARAGWSLTAERVAKAPEDLDALLDRIEGEMAGAPAPAQWTMNSTLAAIGIHSPAHRERALAIGERLGVYRDYPTSKGCTSPFAPVWISEMVRRQG